VEHVQEATSMNTHGFTMQFMGLGRLTVLLYYIDRQLVYCLFWIIY